MFNVDINRFLPEETGRNHFFWAVSSNLNCLQKKLPTLHCTVALF